MYFLAEGDLLFTHTPLPVLSKAEAIAVADAAALRTSGPDPLVVPEMAAGFEVIQVMWTYR